MTQLEKIKSQVDEYGSVSRNWALSQFITRLGSITNLLNKQGYNLTGKYEGKDYIYRNNKPKLAYPYKEKPEPKVIEQEERLL